CGAGPRGPSRWTAAESRAGSAAARSPEIRTVSPDVAGARAGTPLWRLPARDPGGGTVRGRCRVRAGENRGRETSDCSESNCEPHRMDAPTGFEVRQDVDSFA